MKPNLCTHPNEKDTFGAFHSLKIGQRSLHFADIYHRFHSLLIDPSLPAPKEQWWLEHWIEGPLAVPSFPIWILSSGWRKSRPLWLMWLLADACFQILSQQIQYVMCDWVGSNPSIASDQPYPMTPLTGGHIGIGWDEMVALTLLCCVIIFSEHGIVSSNETVSNHSTPSWDDRKKQHCRRTRTVDVKKVKLLELLGVNLYKMFHTHFFEDELLQPQKKKKGVHFFMYFYYKKFLFF